MFKVLLHSSERWRHFLRRWYIILWVNECEMWKCVSFWEGWSSQETYRIQPGNVAQNRDFLTMSCSHCFAVQQTFFFIVNLSKSCKKCTVLYTTLTVSTLQLERDRRGWGYCVVGSVYPIHFTAQSPLPYSRLDSLCHSAPCVPLASILTTISWCSPSKTASFSSSDNLEDAIGNT